MTKGEQPRPRRTLDERILDALDATTLDRWGLWRAFGGDVGIGAIDEALIRMRKAQQVEWRRTGGFALVRPRVAVIEKTSRASR